MTRTLSQKIRFFTFVCIALLAYVHGYNLKEGYLYPQSMVREPMTFTTFVEYLFSNGLLRFRIPLLFMISGYLYAMYDQRPYGQQIKSRFKTLMVPMMLWSAWGLLFTFILQQIPYTAHIVEVAHIDQLGDERPYTEIGWKGIMFRWMLAPVAYQLWFLFALFIYNLMYPLIRWAVIKVPFLWLGLTFILFFLVMNFPLLDSRGLFFFSLGVWLQKKHFSLEKQPPWFSLGLSLILFIGLAVIKTFMAFELDYYDPAAEPMNGVGIAMLILYQASVLAGILAMWFGADVVMHWFLKKKWFNHASSFSFFIFGAHVPLLPYVMAWALMSLDFLPNYRLLCYVFVPLLVLGWCIWMGSIMRRYWPSMYGWLTGGRGF